MVDPKLIAFVNGKLGAYALDWLKDQLVAVVLHPSEKRRNDQALQQALPPGIPVLTWPQNKAALLEFAPTHALSVQFSYIFRQDLLDLCPFANIHTSFLPYGRGAHPNAWAILNDHPAGVTLHLIDSGVDTGPILAQQEVSVDDADTAKTLYEKLQAQARVLIREAVPAWLAGTLLPYPQPDWSCPNHKVADLGNLVLDPERQYTGREVVDLIRACTFPPYDGIRYEINGRILRLRLDIEEEIDV